MSKVDWSLAPDDATHFGSGEDCGYWVKIDKGTQYFINISSWDSGRWKESPEPDEVSLLVERPRKPWSGPEDGLPPVGMRFTFKGLKHRNHDYLYALKDWCAGDVVSVVAHVSLQGELSALYWNEHKMTSSIVRPDLLEPVKTPEQLAADKRETAIREIMDVADVDCRATAARLVDAGFKREAV